MPDAAVATETSAQATVAKKPTHPKIFDVAKYAIKEMKERSGSSLQVIINYMAANYMVDAEKLAFFIRKYLKSAVESGALIRTTGKGACGSCKLVSMSSLAKKPSANAGTGTSAGSKKEASKGCGKKATASAAGAKTKKAASGSPSKSKASSAPKDKKMAAAKKKPVAKKEILKLSLFLKNTFYRPKLLKSSALIRTKGKGASGSCKLESKYSSAKKLRRKPNSPFQG